MNSPSIHGSYRASIVERVLCVSVIGPWNREGTLDHLDELRKLAAPLAKDGRPWASLVDVSEWDLLTPDSVSLFKESTHWASANNRTHLAIVSKESSLMQWLRDKLFEDARVESRFFQTGQGAWDWLQALGFCDKAPLVEHKRL